MPRISKRTIKQIQLLSVYDAVLRERFESTLTGYFADDRPEFWSDDQKAAFDLATEVEHRFREEVLKILGAESELAKE